MKKIDLQKEKVRLEDVIDWARQGPVLLLAPDGQEFFLSEADDFDREVEQLRSSQTFQRFLDERSRADASRPIEEMEKELGEPPSDG